MCDHSTVKCLSCGVEGSPASLASQGVMVIEIVSANEVEAKELQGWKRTGNQTIIAGKVRTVEMQKEGDPLAWLKEDDRIRQATIDKMGKNEKRMYFQQSALYARGMDI